MKQRRFWTNGEYSLNNKNVLIFPPFENTDMEFCCCLLVFTVIFELLTEQPRSGCFRRSCLASLISPRLRFFLRRTEWICLYRNRWVCIIWEIHKDRKHCEDQERRLNNYFLSFILITDHFYVALFAALEQTHCALVACDSERATASSQNIPGLPSGSRAANRN